MKNKHLFVFLLNVLPLTLGSLIGCKGNKDFQINPNPVGQKISYRYKSMGGGEVSDFLYYTDDYFRKPASEFNISLATTSCSMVEAAFPAAKGGLKDYSQKYINFQAMAEKMGFSNLYYNQDYVNIPQENTIGCIMASKKIDDFTLIMLGIRGSEYGAEWAGNFYMDSFGDHLGFNIAANETIDVIDKYIVDNNITGHIKLWMGGFSRSSAVCNLAAGYLDEGIITGEQVLSDTVTYGKDDIYAFCYEVPMGVSIYSPFDVQGPDFNNIYCFINFHDVVPRVAPWGYGFTRYGRQLYTPCSLFNPDLYPTYRRALEFLHNRQEASSDAGGYIVDDFEVNTIDFAETNAPIHMDETKINWQQGLFMQDFIEALGSLGIPGRQVFATQFQTGFMKLFKLINNTASEESRIFTKALINVVLEITDYNLSSVIIDDFFNDRNMLAQDLIPFFLRAYQKYGVTTTAEELGEMLGNFIGALATITLDNKENIASLLSVNNLTTTLNAHSYDVCLSWLRSMDPNFLLEPIDYKFGGSFSCITLTESLNVKVYDEDDALIMQFKKGVPVKISSSNYTYGLHHGNITLYLPETYAYRIVISSEENVTTYYHRQGFDLEGGYFVSKKRNQYAINSNDQLTITVRPSN
ncbi:MAG: hypothetical protein K6F07_03110 [Bacilli bacterium]|nr:hypothetical protein [Bacilli bacterium]